MSIWILIMTVTIYGGGSSVNIHSVEFSSEMACNQARDKWVSIALKREGNNGSAVCVQK